MTAQIIPFPPSKIAKRLPDDVVDGEIVSEVPLDALPASHDMPLPVGNRFAEVAVAPPRGSKRPSARAGRPKNRVEQMPVTCTAVPRKEHGDLRSLCGIVTIDWRGKRPYTVTFDPENENTPNAVIPVARLSRTSSQLTVVGDEGTWRFDLDEEG